MKRNLLIIFMLILGLITACNNQPKNVLSDEKMEAIMVDLFLFEGAANVKNISVDDTIKAYYYNQILQKHRVTLAQYDSSLVWYMRNTEHYTKVHDRVLKRLEKLQKGIRAGKFIHPIAANDSLDSTMIRINKRDIFIGSDKLDNATVFILKDSSVYSGDLFKVRYLVRTEGVINDINALSKVTVFYRDKTKDEKHSALKLSQRVNSFEITIQTKHNKKIDYISVDVLELKKHLKPNQRIYINNIRMYRCFNPYRKVAK